MPLGGMISGTLGLIGTGIQTAHENEVNKQNLAFQKENLRWQQDQWNVTMKREDTAVQRRVADLKAAGLSPTLAAGTSAQAQHAPVTTAPERKATNYDRILQSIGMSQAYLNLVQQKKDIARTEAETERVRELTANDVQNRDIAMKDYILRTEGFSLDKERVAQEAWKIGISQQQLEHDVQRIENEKTRIEQTSRQLLNEEQRTKIQESSLEVTRLYNEARQGLIDEQTYSERLRQMGIIHQNEQMNWELNMMIYDYALLSQLGLPTRTNLPQFQNLNWARGAAANNALEEVARQGQARYYSQESVDYRRLLEKARGAL